MTRTVAIIGATGSQGSSVIQTILSSPEPNNWSIRAITRNAKGAAAKALQGKGVEVVEADLDDVASLKAAFSGCYAVFAVTDFFVPFDANGANAAESIKLEWQKASNIADAFEATPEIEHFIWSTLPHAGKITGGKLHPAHFVAKNRLEERIKKGPELLKKTTFLWVGWYATNVLYPIFRPSLLENTGKYIQLGPAGADVPIPSIGDPKTNLGAFVLAILQQSDKVRNGTYVSAATGLTSMRELVAAWSQVSGNDAMFVQCSLEDYERLWPGWGGVEGPMLQFFNDFGAQVGASEDKILTAADLGVEVQGMTSVVDAIRMAIKGGV